MRRTSIEIAGIVLCWGAAASVQAQPPHPPGPGHAAKPPATVVARVNVNVETDVDVGPADAAQKHDDEDEDEKDEAGSEAGKKADLSELVASVLKQAGPNAGIQVIADININVETSVKVRCLANKAGASHAANAAMASPEGT
ncbi:MAG TPA: hypothetical protein VM510_03565, partial [Caulifigura sp.]|nr:hypothetical protein [Caulifigura sp.]